jgi:hypothetical protein
MSQLQLTTEIADPEATLLARAYALILSWGCPKCGKPYPCPCDVSAGEESAPKDLLIEDVERLLVTIESPQETITNRHSVGITATGNLLVSTTANTTASV